MRFEFHRDKYGIKAIRKKQCNLCEQAARNELPQERREHLQKLIAWLNEAIDRFEES